MSGVGRQGRSFVGGTAGNADASPMPFVVGFVNDEGGVPSFPEGSAAADRGHVLSHGEVVAGIGA